MARRDRSNLSLGLLTVITLAVVASVGASIYRVLSEEGQTRGPDLPSLEGAMERPPQASAADHDRIRRMIGPDGLLPVNIRRYHLRTRRYPSTLRDLIERPIEMGPNDDWGGPYMAAEGLLKDPWGQAYQFRSPGYHNPASYDLWSIGPDGVSDTDDDQGNW